MWDLDRNYRMFHFYYSPAMLCPGLYVDELADTINGSADNGWAFPPWLGLWRVHASPGAPSGKADAGFEPIMMKADKTNVKAREDDIIIPRLPLLLHLEIWLLWNKPLKIREAGSVPENLFWYILLFRKTFFVVVWYSASLYPQRNYFNDFPGTHN